MKQHSRTLIKLIKQHTPNPIAGAEVGVWRGENSFELLEAFPKLFLWMVDEYKRSNCLEDSRLAKLMQSDFDAAKKEAWDKTTYDEIRRVQITQKSAKASDLLKNEVLDFVFIDASHAYEDVHADILAWKDKVRPGGLITGHDYSNLKSKAGVVQAVDEIFGGLANIDRGRVWWVIQI